MVADATRRIHGKVADQSIFAQPTSIAQSMHFFQVVNDHFGGFIFFLFTQTTEPRGFFTFFSTDEWLVSCVPVIKPWSVLATIRCCLRYHDVTTITLIK
jgi:hypothetical protein